MSNEIELKTREISFCDKIANNVLTKESKAFILDKLKEKYDISITHRGAIIVNQNILKNLERNPHIIGVKSSGTNYFLYMTQIQDINIIVISLISLFLIICFCLD